MIRHRLTWSAAALATATALLGACSTAETPATTHRLPAPSTRVPVDPTQTPDPESRARGDVTLGFVGDMHFELHQAALLDHPKGALGAIARTLAEPDLTMANLETAITSRGERLHLDYAFRTKPAALDVLADAGIDIATMANNHGVDYGPVGLTDTLRAVRRSPIPVIGIGRDQREAFEPHRVSVRGTDLAFLAASSEPDQLARSAARPGRPGIAAAFDARPQLLMSAVRKASTSADVVVVYLHWGTELEACPTSKQLGTARALAEAGADVIVGSHAHVLLGSGWLGDTYVNYGLGNFLWYHDHQPDSGVLQLRIRDGAVVGDSWTPAVIRPLGPPEPLRGNARTAAIEDWRHLRGCTGLSARPVERQEALPSYAASVQRIRPSLRARMHASHHAGCPVPMRDLRYLRMSYVGFDAKSHLGEMVVHERHAESVTRVFERLYDARWPIRRIRLVDDYGGDDDRSMAADNTSGYNCRRIAGQASWSAHAYGSAIDVNPMENPDLTGDRVAPPAAARFATIDRSTGARVSPGVIKAGDVVVRAFEEVSWQWGGNWSPEDYQHFSAGGG